MDQTPETPADAQEMTTEALKKWTALALNPTLGEKFEYGGKEFTRRFLNAQDEHDLITLISSVTASMPTGSIAETFALSMDSLFEAVTIILAAQDPECDEYWIRQVEGPRLTQQMLTILLAQIQLQEMTPLLGGLLAAAGLAHAVAAHSTNFPSTLPTIP